MSRTILLLLLAVALSHAQPIVLGVTNSASRSGNLAPGTAAVISGTQLASITAVADGVPPTRFKNVSVTVGGVAAPLRFVSPSQINLVIPSELAVPQPGSAVAVIVTSLAGQSAPFPVLLSRDSPGLFTQDSSATGNVWAFDANNNLVTAVGTDSITLYAAGLGPTNPAPSQVIQDNVNVFVGDRKADVLLAGLVPGYPDLYQLKVAPHGAVTDRVYLQINGWQSNIASVPLTPGSNVANVTGAIDGLYPSTLPQLVGVTGTITASVMLMAGRFTTGFDILPNAKPFSVVATSEGGTAVIDIDPVQGTWQASLSVPTIPARQGNFAEFTYIPVLDFSTCVPTGCTPFLTNIIPLTHFDPTFVRADNLLPVSNVPFTGTVNSAFSSSGTLSGMHFAIDENNLGTLMNFGGFLQIPYAGPSTRTTTFRLYVDGKLIASKDVTYSVL